MFIRDLTYEKKWEGCNKAVCEACIIKVFNNKPGED
jgi:hypothetical protein